MIDVLAEIVPARQAAGLCLGESFGPLRTLGRALKVHESCPDLEIRDIGDVRVWASGGRISQILVRGAYSGRVAGTNVGIGSRLGEFIREVGPIAEGEYDELYCPSVPGIGLETTPWAGPPGYKSIELHLDETATLTDLWVFEPE